MFIIIKKNILRSNLYVNISKADLSVKKTNTDYLKGIFTFSTSSSLLL